MQLLREQIEELRTFSGVLRLKSPSKSSMDNEKETTSLLLSSLTDVPLLSYTQEEETLHRMPLPWSETAKRRPHLP
jgi:hypothetical protein